MQEFQENKVLTEGDELYYKVRGQYGINRNTWYASASKILAEKLNCDFFIFPGHHGSFMSQPFAWSEALLKIIRKGGW